ncbi:MAG: DUF3859 domain-containing protein [Fibrobacterales bacterium]
MASNTDITIESYGLYTGWDSHGGPLPRIVQYTTDIPIGPTSEFGILLLIKKCKNSMLTFTMEHPPWKENGTMVPDFTGEAYIKSNEYRYYIGDRFCEPYEDKAGPWTIMVAIDGTQVATKTFNTFLP